MSVRVLEQIFDRSQATGTTRCVLTALGDVAHHDGVTWSQQGPRENRRSIAHRANCSVRSVERAIEQLVELGELEVRQARRRRSFVNVYRVVVGRIGQLDVEYDRLPFELDEPFASASELLSLGARSTRQVDGLKEGSGVQPQGADEDAPGGTAQPDNLAGSVEAVNPPESERSTRQPDELNPPDATATPSMDPSLDPSEDPSSAAAESSSSTSQDDVERLGSSPLERELRRLRVAPDLRALALADPERAEAWLELARKEATSNAGGFFASQFPAGEWPSPRGEEISAARKHQGRLASLRSLVERGHPEEARALIDDWTITEVERNEYRLVVDELVSERLPEAPAITAEAAA